jgi:penicillin-binding protein 1A
MSLLDLTAAYAAVAGGSPPVEPYGVTGPRDDTLAARIRRAAGGDVLPERAALREMMRATIDYGTGVKAKLPIAAFGKTGTTQDERDAIFVGFAGDLVVGVWVGNDDNSPMRGVLGSTLPAVMWRDFMRAALPEIRQIAEREEQERRLEEEAAEAAIGDVDLSGVLGEDVEAVLAGERIDMARAGRLLGQLGNIIATAPADAEELRAAAEDLQDRINDAIEAEAERAAEEATGEGG